LGVLAWGFALVLAKTEAKELKEGSGKNMKGTVPGFLIVFMKILS
jgi:hypothetical protein